MYDANENLNDFEDTKSFVAGLPVSEQIDIFKDKLLSKSEEERKDFLNLCVTYFLNKPEFKNKKEKAILKLMEQ